jgi:hypothetical protein
VTGVQTCALPICGLLLLYHNRFVVKRLSDFFISKALELACFVLRCQSKTTLLLLIYRPPASSLADFLNEFTDLIMQLTQRTDFIICGDFNLDILTNLPSDKIISFFTSLNLTQHVTTVTHPRWGRILDLVFTRSSNSNAIASIIMQCFSHFVSHLLIHHLLVPQGFLRKLTRKVLIMI